MCNYQFTTFNNVLKPECTLPAIFDEIGTKLPFDEEGLCLFHSGNIEWKVEQNLPLYFKELLHWGTKKPILLDHCVDLRETILIGSVPKRNNRKELQALKGNPERRIELFNLDFVLDIDLNGAQILDHLSIKGCTVQHFESKKASFHSIMITESTLKEGWQTEKASFEGNFDIDNCTFGNFSDFFGVNFLGMTFIWATFWDAVNFDEAIFSDSEDNYVSMYCDFKKHVTFRKSQFNFLVCFENTTFGKETIFLETIFKGRLEFNKVKVKDLVLFRGTEQVKLFEHSVEFDIKEEEIEGKITFEHVNFNNILEQYIPRLKEMNRKGKIEIGVGCIKYRNQTNVKSIEMERQNQTIVLEMIQTFANYFTNSNSLQLGLEIVERNENQITFFFFSDENITEEEFLKRLQDTEQSLWNLLALKEEELRNPNTTKGNSNESFSEKIVNAVDGISALMGIFFRMSVRISTGQWTERHTQSLVQATRFSSKPIINTHILHVAINKKYSTRQLFDYSNQQHIGTQVNTTTYIENNHGEANNLDANKA